MGTPSAVQLAEENRYLNDELNRVETVLNLTRAEKDELSIRYNAISDRVSRSSRLASPALTPLTLSLQRGILKNETSLFSARCLPTLTMSKHRLGLLDKYESPSIFSLR